MSIDETQEIDLAEIDDAVFAFEESTAPFRPTLLGWSLRLIPWLGVAWLVLLLPANVWSPIEVGVADIDDISMLVIFAIVGLSINVLMGYAGQISLGHQAFVGIGAFTSAYLATDQGLTFWVTVPLAALLGALQALLLGAVSLRVTGLYFALVTLAYGAFAEDSLFAIGSLTGGDAGKAAARPVGFESGYSYYYVCLGFLAFVWYLDWRLTRSKAGRALNALRENPRVAASYGIHVNAYMLLAFMVSGFFAGIAGALWAHHQELIVADSFNFQKALLFVLMAVVGGLRNRLGVVLGSAFFALLGSGKLVEILTIGDELKAWIGLPPEFVGLVVGPILLLLTITKFPGGIGQQVAPIAQWMRGGRFDLHAGAVHEVEVDDVRA